ncbi:MAG: hypothetical protein R6V33_07880 [Pelovirga sp.]
MKKNHPESSLREAWVLFMILGIVMINFPFIHIFDSDMSFLGIPRLVLYFMYGWPLSIAVIWMFVRRLEKESRTEADLEHNSTKSSSNQ